MNVSLFTSLRAGRLLSIRRMGIYCRYDADPHDYDDGRKAQGAHHYLGLVYSLTGKTAGNLHLLDIGCGTGNHAKFLLENGLARATMTDSSIGMLEIAREKLQPFMEQHRVVMQPHKLPTIPFHSSSFDVVMSNQVFHHLTDQFADEHDYTEMVIRKVTEEAFRVLKPNGVFIVNSTTPFQLRNGFWFKELFKKSVERMVPKLTDQNEYLTLLRQTGFGESGMFVETSDVLYSPDWYFREDGPLYRKWRNASSIISGASKEELEKILEKVRKMKDEGKLEEYMLKNDRMREHVGQYCIYYARKA